MEAMGAPEGATTTEQERRRPDQAVIVLGLTLTVFIALSLALPGFLSLGNLFVLARGISVLGILGLGMAVVVIGRGIDLSLIASLAVSAAVAVSLANAGMPMLTALFCGLFLAVAIGIGNGFLISVIEIPPLFTTLASGLFVLGVTRALVVPHYQVFLAPGHELFLRLGGTVAGGLPVPLLVFAGCAILLHLFLSRTVLGRSIYAHGDNAQAARLSGLGRVCKGLRFRGCASIWGG